MNLISLERVSKAHEPEALLDDVSLGVAAGERIGVVGRNGSGKSTLLSLLAGSSQPDGGRVARGRALRVGHLPQRDELPGAATVRGLVLGDRAEHEWAADARTRDVVAGLLGGADWDARAGNLSSGQRRRVALAQLLVGDHDVLLLDEPTNHLDIEAIDWLARHLTRRGDALALVTHDRWLLDTVCDRTWEVTGGGVHRYDGGYASYVLARAERARLAAAAEDRRQNLLRKELAWLRRGPPARTSKPKFRIEAANALIAGEPPPRDQVELLRFAGARLGRSVYDVEDATVRRGGDAVLDAVTWRLGPGDRIGVLGANGLGKTTLLQLLAGELPADAGRVRRGQTVRAALMSQELVDGRRPPGVSDPVAGRPLELDPAQRVLESVEEIRRAIRVGKRELSATQLLDRLGFRGDALHTPVGRLSGGERRRLQLLRLLMGEPNVLLLDEPTNDLDTDTLTELEDLLDGWPGTLVVVSHDRWFLERVTDRVVALLGDGKVTDLPGGVEQYLERRRAATADRAAPASTGRPRQASAGGNDREARRELNRLERRVQKLTVRTAELHELLAAHATDHVKLQELDAELRSVQSEKDQAEESWLELATQLDG